MILQKRPLRRIPLETKYGGDDSIGVMTRKCKIPVQAGHNAPVEFPHIWSRLSPATPTHVWDSYWRFAAERQEVFFARMEDRDWPFTDDPILRTYRFTNVYRASDRVSQYLIRNVIYSGLSTPEETFFRILLFKTFNRIDTWERLTRDIGELSWSNYVYSKYDTVLLKALDNGERIYSAAYIMASGKSAFFHERKHQNHLRLIELMMHDGVPQKVVESRSMEEVFNILKSYPTIGDFLAYQYVIDINYSNLIDFSEMDFVVAGPGAKEGIRKCFHDTGGWSPDELIKWVTDSQEREFNRLEIDFRDLFGRPLQLIDCQNLFCEIDKYARVAYPEMNGDSGRKRIKQMYKLNRNKIDYRYPPKWQLDVCQKDNISETPVGY